MTKKSAKELLEGAYQLGTPKSNQDYYRDFSGVYDQGFAEEMGYNAPQLIAEFFKTHQGPDDHPIADIGCGTGLVASFLDAYQIDGFDVSKDMLRVANQKSLYRKLYDTDLTQPIGRGKGAYGALISAGTFTHGHLGPKDLENCLQLLRPNGICTVTINVSHFERSGFSSALGKWQTGGRISLPVQKTAQIYTRDDHEHSLDEIYLVTFRKID